MSDPRMLPAVPSSVAVPSAAPAATAPPKAGGNLPARVAAWAVPALLEKWRFLTAWVVASAALAVALAVTLKSETWEASGTLVYTSLPMPEHQKDLYASPDLKTLATLVKSPQVLDPLLQEFSLQVPRKVLEKNIDVSVPTGTKALVVTVRWAEGKTGTAMASRVIDLFTHHVAQLRRQKLESDINDLLESSRHCDERVKAASAALQKFNKEEGITDLKDDLVHLNQDVSSLEGALAMARRSEANARAQHTQLEKHLSDLRTEQEKEAEDAKKFEASEETVADNRRRQDRLRELITDERKNIEIQAQLDAKRRELDRMLPLVVKGIRSQTDADRLRAEIGALVAKIQETDKIKQWTEELQKIDKVVVPKGQKKNQSSPIIQQTLFRKLELELQMVAMADEIAQQEKGLATKRAQIDRLGRLQSKDAGLAKELEAAYAERQQLTTQIGSLRHLQELGPSEFVVASPPTTGPYPTSTSTKLIFGGTLGAGVALGLALVLGLQAFRYAKTPRFAADRLGLPVLATFAGTEADDQAVRRFALQLRQSLPEPGALLLFTSLGGTDQARTWIARVADCLSQRDERVLVLDACLNQPTDGPPREPHLRRGLGEYLGYQVAEAEELPQTGDRCGVEHIDLGHVPVPAEALATHRWRELLERLRETYSIILVQGPPLASAVDLQLLAAQVQGMVVVADAGGPAPAWESLAALRRLGAPLLGSVVLPASK